MTAFFGDPDRTALSLLMEKKATLRVASAVTWTRVACGAFCTLSPATLIAYDANQPPVVFADDGTARQGQESWLWTAPIFLTGWDAKMRVKAKKVLAPADIEGQRWRLVQERSRRQARCVDVHRQLREAGPVHGTFGTGDAERVLCCRPTTFNGASLLFSSLRGDETQRNDLAELYFRASDALNRAHRVVAFANEALRYALLRHLPDAPTFGAVAHFQVNGRDYWLRGDRDPDGSPLIVWIWLAFPDTAVPTQTFGG